MPKTEHLVIKTYNNLYTQNGSFFHRQFSWFGRRACIFKSIAYHGTYLVKITLYTVFIYTLGFFHS